MARRGSSLGPLRGPWAEGYRLLGSSWTALLLVAWLVAGALRGLAAEPGAHPFDGVSAWLPAVLLPFVLAVRIVERGWRWTDLVAPAGLGLVVLGLALDTPRAGKIELAGAAPPEFLSQPDGQGRAIRVHLGGPLDAALDEDTLHLRLGVPKGEVLSEQLDLGGAGLTAIGGWQLYPAGRAPAEAPTLAHLKMTPRAGGEAVERTLRAGTAFTLPDQTVVSVQRISPDFGRALGPAAQIAIQWPEGNATDWFFVQAPDLDARVGKAPWIVELVAVRAAPAFVLGARAEARPHVFQAGWLVVAIGLLLGLRRTA